MQRFKKLAPPVFLLLAFTLAPRASEDVLGVPIGACIVALDFNEVNASGNVDAFVPTGSDNGICLVTLGDSNGYSAGPSPAICVPRTFQWQKGVRIVVIPYFTQLPSDLVLNLTVYQRGARGYGHPVLYTGP